MTRRCNVALDAVNLSKNRYRDVLPCKFTTYQGLNCICIFDESEIFFTVPCFSVDKNRVVLKSSTDYRPEALGYINASLVSVEILSCVCLFDNLSQKS